MTKLIDGTVYEWESMAFAGSVDGLNVDGLETIEPAPMPAEHQTSRTRWMVIRVPGPRPGGPREETVPAMRVPVVALLLGFVWRPGAA